MSEEASKYLGVAFLVLAIINVSVVPLVVLHCLRKLREKVDYLQVSVDVIDMNLRDNDDPDPGDEDNEILPSNVVAIGKRR